MVPDDAQQTFDDLAEGFLVRPGVDIGPMFGTEGLRIRGKVFAFLIPRAGLVLKVPEARADELVDQPGVERMVMRDRPMREWIIADHDHHETWPALAAEAFAYLDEITP
ncbi:MAG: hypothetical protein ABWY03_04525 [Microbacterium sp.]